MFNVTDVPTFARTVTIMVPEDDGHREETLRVTYRVVPTDQAAPINLNDGESVRQFLEIAIVRFDDLVDTNKNPVPYSDEIRARVLLMPHARAPLVGEYIAAVSKAKLGN